MHKQSMGSVLKFLNDAARTTWRVNQHRLRLIWPGFHSRTIFQLQYSSLATHLLSAYLSVSQSCLYDRRTLRLDPRQSIRSAFSAFASASGQLWGQLGNSNGSEVCSSTSRNVKNLNSPWCIWLWTELAALQQDVLSVYGLRINYEQ